jgi:hypothetical protein
MSGRLMRVLALLIALGAVPSPAAGNYDSLSVIDVAALESLDTVSADIDPEGLTPNREGTALSNETAADVHLIDTRSSAVAGEDRGAQESAGDAFPGRWPASGGGERGVQRHLDHRHRGAGRPAPTGGELPWGAAIASAS